MNIETHAWIWNILFYNDYIKYIFFHDFENTCVCLNLNVWFYLEVSLQDFECLINLLKFWKLKRIFLKTNSLTSKSVYFCNGCHKICTTV